MKKVYVDMTEIELWSLLHKIIDNGRGGLAHLSSFLHNEKISSLEVWKEREESNYIHVHFLVRNEATKKVSLAGEGK